MNGHSTSAAVFGGLLALLLGAAWMQYTAEPVVDLEGKVLLLPGEADEIERITWTSKGKDKAVIERKSDDFGEYLWVSYTRYEEVKPEETADTEEPTASAPPSEDGSSGEADAAETENTAAETENTAAETENTAAETENTAADDDTTAPLEPVYQVKEEKVFKVGERGDELVDALSPLLALRTIEADAERLETIGFSDVTERLEIIRKGRTQVLEFGGEVYGSRNRYARNPDTQEVFLVDADTIRSLRFARTRLPDRTLWPYARPDVVAATLSGPAGSLAVRQENASDPDKASWVPADDDAEVDAAQVETWMDKAFKLKAGSYEGGGQEANAPEERFSLVFEDSDGGSLVLVVEEDADGNWWGKSSHTRARVTLLKTQVEPLFEDIAALTGG